jgi:hypothetical protein
MRDLGLQTLRLPLGVSETDNHVPIWVSPNISSKRRIIIFFGERNQDLGIFSYRVTGDDGINVGSCLNFVRAIQQGPTATSDDQVPGIIIANPGQLYWYRGGGRAVTATEWQNLPRDHAVNEPFRVDEVLNQIPDNATFREHVNYVFERLLPAVLDKDAELDLIGLEWSGAAALEYLAANCKRVILAFLSALMSSAGSKWSSRVSGICLGGPQHKVEDLVVNFNASKAFIDFLSKRCRAYFVSPERLESIVEGRGEFGCNCLSSGEELYPENVIVRSWRSMLDWFNLIHTLPDYEEPELIWVEGKDGQDVSPAANDSSNLVVGHDAKVNGN